jgi:cytosine/adenosine deaminase-related metal-dependent hydrolase
MSPVQRLLETFRGMEPADRQNRLMRLGDREIAMAMTHMKEEDRDLLLSCLGRAKVQRIRDEMRLQARLAVSQRDYLKALALVEHGLGSAGGRAALGSYIRPRGRRGPRYNVG